MTGKPGLAGQERMLGTEKPVTETRQGETPLQ